MQTIKLGSSNLLEYEPKYGVLICRKCQYAIQKSALQSHLLRHKIYRDERRRLLSAIAEFDLLEPQDVSLPPSSSQPIKALPIIPGSRCAAVGCDYLCASSKRMRRHWSEIHGLSEPPSDFSTLACPAKLQTFFRGTKLRYFEVSASLGAHTTEAPPLATIQKLKERDVGNVTLSPLSSPTSQWHRKLKPSFISPVAVSLDFDLGTLAYFHHFTTVTCFTLPCSVDTQHLKDYWQKTAVTQALQRKWLMCGILATSALHMAVLAGDERSKNDHRLRMAQLYRNFLAGAQELTQNDQNVEDEARKVWRQLDCILHCALWVSDESTLNQEIISNAKIPFKLQLLMSTIRSSLLSNPTPSTDSLEDNHQEQMFVQARNILDVTLATDTRGYGTSSLGYDMPSTLLDHLHTLPSRMAEVLGKPDNTLDVFATLSAIKILADCYDISFMSNEVNTTWHALAAWLKDIPQHFNQMVSSHNQAALVVLTHWAALLVDRAEHCGCWFMKGMARKILLHVSDILSNEDCAIQSLVQGLMT